MTLALLLAITCWAEAGPSLDDCTALAETHRNRHGEITAEIVCAYAAALNRDCTMRERAEKARPWLAGLNVEGTEPEGWPANLAWPEWRPAWMALLERAGQIVRGEAAPVCRGNPEHHGNASDARAWLASGWRAAWCAGTTGRQLYLERP